MAQTQPTKSSIVIFAKDTKRLSVFYQKTLNLEVVEQEKSHEVLTGHSIEVVIHAIPAKHATAIKIEEPPVLRANSAIKPAFWVEDLAATRKTATRYGGQLKPLAGVWKIRGALVLDGNDPEGNVIQFKQPE